MEPEEKPKTSILENYKKNTHKINKNVKFNAEFEEDFSQGDNFNDVYYAHTKPKQQM